MKEWMLYVSTSKGMTPSIGRDGKVLFVDEVTMRNAVRDFMAMNPGQTAWGVWINPDKNEGETTDIRGDVPIRS